MSKESTTVIRLNLLYGESRLTQSEFARLCGVSASALKNYLNGDRPFPTINVIKLCKQLSVSSDWLLGLSDVRQPSTDLRGVCEFTGLSESAVEALQSCQNCGAVEILKTINALIVSDITPVQIEEGNLNLQSQRRTYFSRDGAGIQEGGLIAALHSNLEADLKCEEAKVRLADISKADTKPEELEEWFDLKRRINSAKINLENSGYHMMLTCTTATAEGQQYHETLKAEYQKGGSDNGSGNE